MIHYFDEYKEGQVRNNSLINADCFDVFPYIADKSINAIICDLPFG